MDTSYTIYVKTETAKRYSPLGRNGPVVNLFHAVTYDQKEAADRICSHLIEDNPQHAFQVRKN